MTERRELATNGWDLPHEVSGNLCPCGRPEGDPLHSLVWPQTAAEHTSGLVTEKGS